MPTLHRLPSARILIRSGDHLPPHVHVVWASGEDAFIEIETLLVRTTVAAHRLTEALAWIRANQAHLMQEWTKWNG